MLKIGSCFSGVGGLEFGLESSNLPASTIWQIENNPFCRKILIKHWPNADLFNDIKTINLNKLNYVDIICGGFPCQGISIAGKRKGLKNAKSSLWSEMYRIINYIRPRFIVLENSSNIIRRGLSEVLWDLTSIGYDAEWVNLQAVQELAAVHIRKRFFLIAYTSKIRSRSKNTIQAGWQTSNELFNDIAKNESRFRNWNEITKEIQIMGSNYWEEYKIGSPFCRVDDGISFRLDRLKALGNAVMPQAGILIGNFIYNYLLKYHIGSDKIR